MGRVLGEERFISPLGEKCPYCGKNLTVLTSAVTNVENYGKPVLVSSECCHKPIRLTRVVRVDAKPQAVGNRKTDDWGQPFAKEN